MATNFDLVSIVVAPEIPGVYRFAWGSQQPLAGATLGDQSAYGSFTTTYVAQGGFAVGIADPVFPVPKVSPTGADNDILTNLTDPVTPPNYAGVYSFRWGNAQGIVHPALPTTQFGYAYVANAAAGVGPTSIVPEESNAHKISFAYSNQYIPDTPGFPVDFDLIQSVENLSVVNFEFSGFISVGTGSISDGAFGSPTVYNLTTIVTPFGWIDEVFGTPQALGLLNRIYPPSMDSTVVFGAPSLQNQKLSITTTGVNTSTVGGVAYVVNTLQIMSVPGISAPTVSPDGRLNFMQAITQTTGIPAADVSASTNIYNSTQVITTPQLNNSSVGGASRVSNYLQGITTPGISAPAVPTGEVVSSLNAIIPAGVSAPAVSGSTTLTKFNKELTNVGGIAAPTVSSSTALTKMLQFVTQDTGISAPVVSAGTSLGLPAIQINVGIPAPAVVGVGVVESLFIPPKHISSVGGITAPIVSATVLVYDPDTPVPTFTDHGTPYSCLPTYDYVPTSFVASDVDCVAPGYDEHRSRRTVSTNLTTLFFRSKDQGESTNMIDISLQNNTFTVYYDGDVVEQYTNISMGQGGIASLRVTLSASEWIEMPSLGSDVFDSRTHENDGPAITAVPPATSVPAGGLAPFARQSLIGGSGPPVDYSGLASIRTGPTRTMCIVHTTESQSGSPIALHQPKQWNGNSWIGYSNSVQGSCPL